MARQWLRRSVRMPCRALLSHAAFKPAGDGSQAAEWSTVTVRRAHVDCARVLCPSHSRPRRRARRRARTVLAAVLAVAAAAANARAVIDAAFATDVFAAAAITAAIVTARAAATATVALAANALTRRRHPCRHRPYCGAQYRHPRHCSGLRRPDSRLPPPLPPLPLPSSASRNTPLAHA
jgi:hypothetical protein